MFRNTPNVHVIDKPVEILLNSKKCLLVPWLTDLSAYKPSTFDMMIGHFEISSKCLIQSYIEDNAAKRAAARSVSANLESDELLKSSGRKSVDLIGNFVDLVKPDGTIYAGHIHNRKEFRAKGRRFIFVGSPYQQTLGEIDSVPGYYVLDENGESCFVKTESAPKHVRISMSDAISGKFDFRLVAGSIIQKIYDIDVPAKDEAAVNQKINDFKPYEELLPEYRVSLNPSTAQNDAETLDLIKKSKLEYMRNYVDKIDQSVLDEQKLDRDKLFETLKAYYKKVAEN